MAERELYETLAAYEDAARAPGGVDLPAFVADHPEHSREIVDYAAYQFVFEHGAVYNADVMTADAEERLIERARLARDKRAATSTHAGPISSLVDAAKERGLTVPALAARLRISPLEVTKLNQRLFRPASIPASLLKSLSDAVGQTAEAVAAYLRLPPTLAQASYKADQAPRITDQIDFADAIAASRSLSPEDRAYWQQHKDEG